MRIGIVQTRGIGDIVIAAPIAMYWVDRGHDVFWPIDADFIEAFTYALPGINFLPVDKAVTGSNTAEFFIETPRQILADLGCDQIHVLYSYLTGYDFGYNHLSEAVSFDCYKYAVAGVPLSEKWRLKIRRNVVREAKLYGLLDLDPGEDFVVCHEQGTVHGYDFTQDCERYTGGVRRVCISPLTSNFFDWLGVLENCRAFFTVNSLYSNLVDQLNLPCEKYMKAQTVARWTPILAADWTYI
jgi:hypothetical protein